MLCSSGVWGGMGRSPPMGPSRPPSSPQGGFLHLFCRIGVRFTVATAWAAPGQDSGGGRDCCTTGGARWPPYQAASVCRRAAPARHSHGTQRRHTRLCTKGQHRAAADAPLQRPLRRPPPRAEVLHPHHRRQARDNLCGAAQGPQRYQDSLTSIVAVTRQDAEVDRPPVLVRPSTRPQLSGLGGYCGVPAGNNIIVNPSNM
jgi:hypothetical protein